MLYSFVWRDPSLAVTIDSKTCTDTLTSDCMPLNGPVSIGVVLPLPATTRDAFPMEHRTAQCAQRAVRVQHLPLAHWPAIPRRALCSTDQKTMCCTLVGDNIAQSGYKVTHHRCAHRTAGNYSIERDENRRHGGGPFSSRPLVTQFASSDQSISSSFSFPF